MYIGSNNYNFNNSYYLGKYIEQTSNIALRSHLQLLKKLMSEELCSEVKQLFSSSSASDVININKILKTILSLC